MPRLQNMESCYISTFARDKDSVEEYEGIREDVSVLKRGVDANSKNLHLFVFVGWGCKILRRDRYR